MTFLMMVRHADWVRDLLDLAMTRSIATVGWVALLSSICATVVSTSATASRGFDLLPK
jgi:hypothetical protein